MIREFECEKCNNTVEVWENFDTIPLCCNKCGGKIKKIISKSSFVLKGSGWAFDNYGSKTKNKTNNN